MASGLPRVIAETSYPSAAKDEAEKGPRTSDDRDSSWDEDLLAAWEAVALFGGLLLLEGGAIWVVLTRGDGAGQIPPGYSLVALGVLLVFAGFVPMFRGYTEMAWAIYASALVGMVVGLTGVLAFPPAGHGPFGPSGAMGRDTAVVLGLLAVGAGTLALGVFRSATVNRRLNREE
jgi:hypothetical protein